MENCYCHNPQTHILHKYFYLLKIAFLSAIIRIGEGQYNWNWSLSDNKSLQFYRTLLSILANISSAMVWIVSILWISSSVCLFSRFFSIVLYSFMHDLYHCYLHVLFLFYSLARFGYIFWFLFSRTLSLWSARVAKSINWQILFFLST